MENILDASTNHNLIQDRKKYYHHKRQIWRSNERYQEKKRYKQLHSHPNILPHFIKLPQDIKSKILTYYLSFGSPCTKIIRPEIINKCRNNSITLWFANIDYFIQPNQKYMLNKSIGCPFEILCELRIALIDSNILNRTADNYLISRRMPINDNLNTIKKNDLLRRIEEEEEIILSNKVN